MTTTSVKDVSIAMSAMVANAGNSVGTTSEISFQSVWSSQSGKGQAQNGPDVSKSGLRKVDPREEALKANKTVRKQVKDTSEHSVEENEPDEEQIEKAMEVIGTAASEMMQQVADTFGMSVEELRQLMNELNMDTVDIMNPEMLNSLLLKAAGAEDSMSLLTNEALYADFKQLLELQQQLLTEASDELQMSAEQLAGLMEEWENLISANDTEGIPEASGTETVIELTVDDSVRDVRMDPGKDANPAITAQNGEGTTALQKADGNARTGSENEHSNEQAGNPILQQLKTDAMQLQESTSLTSSPWDADTQDVMRQIMDYMRIQIKPDVSDLEMKLHPESLGTLQIHVSSKGGVVTANFVTQNEAVKAALESQMVQLKENFAEQGVKVEAIEVTVQAHQFERNLEQGRDSNKGEPAKKGKTRRINLDTNVNPEDMAEMSQEDTLVAEMMTVNGNTVDYTA